MKKISINMLSNADKVDGQGVGSAYLEQVALIQNELDDYFDVLINSSQECDIIHCHTILPKYLIQMKKNKGVNVAYVHFLPDTLDGSIRLPKHAFHVFKKYVTYFYNTADYLIVVNPIFIDGLVEFGIRRDKIKYIPNYVSKDTFYKLPKEKNNETRQKYGIKEDDFVVLGVGQVQTRKGVKDFIEVAKMMNDVTFIWAGGFSFGMITDGYDELKDIYENPPQNVKFIGIIPRNEMNAIYNMADVLFMPSYNELFPMSILEAVNSQKPLLLRDLELYKDILFEKYLNASTNNEFVKHLNDLKMNNEIYKQYSSYSLEISEYYSKEHIKEMWKDFYISIVKKEN
ncbi:MAG: glycosyltransferase family 4 protein [Erysipelotrichales bacterium]|nr:glycosyltransferase family 4 protein [Erysipelotrichales bacterium]